jgi:hypothetical protein
MESGGGDETKAPGMEELLKECPFNKKLQDWVEGLSSMKKLTGRFIDILSFNC